MKPQQPGASTYTAAIARRLKKVSSGSELNAPVKKPPQPDAYESQVAGVPMNSIKYKPKKQGFSA